MRIFRKIIAQSQSRPHFGPIDSDFEKHVREQSWSYGEADRRLLRRVYAFARDAHHERGKPRATGEPYIIHPVAVANILAGFSTDVALQCAAILHDVKEDCGATDEEIMALFGGTHRLGEEVLHIVNGVTKIGKEADAQERGKGTLIKILEFTARDLRVAIIKIADRTHNMLTLGVFDDRPDKQRRIAQETVEVYIPLARLLKMHGLATALDNLAFQYLEPDAFQKAKAFADRKLQQLCDGTGREFRMLTRLVCKIEDHARRHRIAIQRPAPSPVGSLPITLKPYREIATRLDTKMPQNIHPADWMTVNVATPEEKRVSALLGAFSASEEFRITGSTHHDSLTIGQRTATLCRTEIGGPEGMRIILRTSSGRGFKLFQNGWMAITHTPDWFVPTPPLRDEFISVVQQTAQLTESDVRLSISALGPDDPITLYTPAFQPLTVCPGDFPLDLAAKAHSSLVERAVAITVNGVTRPLNVPFTRDDNNCNFQILTRTTGYCNVDYLRLVKTLRGRQAVLKALRRRPLYVILQEGKTLLIRAFQSIALSDPHLENGHMIATLYRAARSLTSFALDESETHLKQHAQREPETMEGDEQITSIQSLRQFPEIRDTIHYAIGTGVLKASDFAAHFLAYVMKALQERREHRERRGRPHPSLQVQGSLKDPGGWAALFSDLGKLKFRVRGIQMKGNLIVVEAEEEGNVRAWQLATLMNRHTDNATRKDKKKKSRKPAAPPDTPPPPGTLSP